MLRGPDHLAGRPLGLGLPRTLRVGRLHGGLLGGGGRDGGGGGRHGQPGGRLGDGQPRTALRPVDDQIAAEDGQSGVGALVAGVGGAVGVLDDVLDDQLLLGAEPEALGGRALGGVGLPGSARRAGRGRAWRAGRRGGERRISCGRRGGRRRRPGGRRRCRSGNRRRSSPPRRPAHRWPRLVDLGCDRICGCWVWGAVRGRDLTLTPSALAARWYGRDDRAAGSPSGQGRAERVTVPWRYRVRPAADERRGAAAVRPGVCGGTALGPHTVGMRASRPREEWHHWT
ncbi:hypothetical protein SANTM175S_00649 [Streptomyces antimycoticus]